MRQRHILGFAFAAAGFLMMAPAVHGQASAKPQPAVQKDAKPQASASGHAKQEHSEGERVFAQNCSRCHTAPEGFSPSISGTIVRHMRVRASLSEHDEKALLEFLNP